jgi:hypothetical protein
LVVSLDLRLWVDGTTHLYARVTPACRCGTFRIADLTPRMIDLTPRMIDLKLRIASLKLRFVDIELLRGRLKLESPIRSFVTSNRRSEPAGETVKSTIPSRESPI